MAAASTTQCCHWFLELDLTAIFLLNSKFTSVVQVQTRDFLRIFGTLLSIFAVSCVLKVLFSSAVDSVSLLFSLSSAKNPCKHSQFCQIATLQVRVQL